MKTTTLDVLIAVLVTAAVARILFLIGAQEYHQAMFRGIAVLMPLLVYRLTLRFERAKR